MLSPEVTLAEVPCSQKLHFRGEENHCSEAIAIVGSELMDQNSFHFGILIAMIDKAGCAGGSLTTAPNLLPAHVR
jgi:hypothetical protein